jgi:hypothetical protein
MLLTGLIKWRKANSVIVSKFEILNHLPRGESCWVAVMKNDVNSLGHWSKKVLEASVQDCVQKMDVYINLFCYLLCHVSDLDYV